MTAEIVVMNTGGIALATDSALTIRGQKVYNSANKLFHFSKEHTIGVMTYGLSSMFHVPWETLIKVFEKKLNSHAFDTVKEYMEDFLQFLNQNNYDQFMTEVNEERFIDQTLYSNLNRLYEELSHMNKSLYSDYGELRLQNEIQEMYVHQADHYLAKRNQILTEKVFPKGFDQSDYDQLFEKYENRVVELIQNKFEDHLYIEEWLDTIKDLMIQSLIKDFSNNYSGIVFAGYGKKEIFPSLYLIIIDGKINNKTKYFIRKKRLTIQLMRSSFLCAKRYDKKFPRWHS
ncbi:hypothetical protein [Bacillus sp. JCM 19034]|uniref:hypothetical protein n=1 Tax=Bacillus sp. JCM 19034 TaxID=1481928 RepID=UPI000780D4F9|nr:hypothetical protein [Bacillus sp. JCM 19034]